MNRSKSALIAVLITTLAVVPATAQQASFELRPSGELCSGCFAYLEFPPAQSDTPSGLAARHQATPMPITAEWQGRTTEPAPSLVASTRQ